MLNWRPAGFQNLLFIYKVILNLIQNLPLGSLVRWSLVVSRPLLPSAVIKQSAVMVNGDPLKEPSPWSVVVQGLAVLKEDEILD